MSNAEMLATIKPATSGRVRKNQSAGFQVAVHGSTAVTTHLDDEYETLPQTRIALSIPYDRHMDEDARGLADRRCQVLALHTDPPPFRSRAPDGEYTGRYA